MKSITENLALFSLIAISLGFYRLYRFYMVFNIDITSYIDLSEIFQLEYLFFLFMSLGLCFIILVAIAFIDNKIKFSNPSSISNYIESLSNYEFYQTGLIVIVLFFFTLIIGGVISTTNAHAIRDGKPDYKITITKENKTIATDSILVYVGKTKNYLFLYNRKNKSSIAIKMEDVKELEMKTTKYFSPY